MHKTQDKKRRRLGDRKDGRLIRTGDPMMRVATFIMPSRTGAQNFFQDGFSTEEIKADITNLKEADTAIGERIDGLADVY